MIATLYGHNSYVWTVRVEQNTGIIFSGSDDGTIKEWNSTSFQLIETIQADSSGVLSLMIQANNSILSGSYSQTIKKWSRKLIPFTTALIQTFKYNLTISALAFYGFEFLLIGSDSKILVCFIY